MRSLSICTDRRTWIEHWPPAVAGLSVPHTSVQMTPVQMHALGRRNGVGLPAFDAAGAAAVDATLNALAAQIDDAMLELAGGAPSHAAFVRLGSRSPKDTPLFLLTGGRATCGADAVPAVWPAAGDAPAVGSQPAVELTLPGQSASQCVSAD